MDAKINIKGLKQSGRLVLLRVKAQQDQTVMPELCRRLADNRINIAFLNLSCDGPAHSAFCCVEISDRAVTVSCINQDPSLKPYVEICKEAVGLLSVYPHQASLNALGRVLQLISDNHLILHGFASSIAALTFVLDYQSLDDAATQLAHALKLTPDQIVREPAYRLRQEMPSKMPILPFESSDIENHKERG